MIRSFRHKGLSRLYEQGNAKGISASLVPKVSRVLARFDVVTVPEQMNLRAGDCIR
jgi:proteic killer suppression protein